MIQFAYTCPNEDCEADIDCYIEPTVPGNRRGHPDNWTPDEGGDVDCPDMCPECGTSLDGDHVYAAGMDWLKHQEPDYPDD